VSTSPTPFDADVTSNDSDLTSGAPLLPTIDNTAIDNTATVSTDDDKSDHSGTDNESDHLGTDNESDHLGTDNESDHLGTDNESDHLGTNEESDVDMQSGDDKMGSDAECEDPEVAGGNSTTSALCATSGPGAPALATLKKKCTRTLSLLKDAMTKPVYLSQGLSAPFSFEIGEDGLIYITYLVKNSGDDTVTKIEYTVGPGRYESNTENGTVNTGGRADIIDTVELMFQVYALYLLAAQESAKNHAELVTVRSEWATRLEITADPAQKEILTSQFLAEEKRLIDKGVTFNEYLKNNLDAFPNFGSTCDDEGNPGVDPEFGENKPLAFLLALLHNGTKLSKVTGQTNIARLRIFTVLFLQAVCFMSQSNKYTFNPEKGCPAQNFWKYYLFADDAHTEKGEAGRPSILGYWTVQETLRELNRKHDLCENPEEKAHLEDLIKKNQADFEMDIPYINWDKKLLKMMESFRGLDRRTFVQMLMGRSFVNNKKLPQFNFGCKKVDNFEVAQSMQRKFGLEVIKEQFEDLMKATSFVVNQSLENVDATGTTNNAILEVQEALHTYVQLDMPEPAKDAREQIQALTTQSRDLEKKNETLEKELDKKAKELANLRDQLATQKKLDASAKQAIMKAAEKVANAKNALMTTRSGRTVKPKRWFGDEQYKGQKKARS